MIRVLIVDNHPIVRKGIAAALSAGVLGAHRISECGAAAEAMDLIWKQSFDLVLLEVSLPGMNGLDLLKWIKQQKPSLPVLVLSSYSEDQFGIRALRNGAAGYLTKGAAVPELLNAVNTALVGRRYIRTSLAEKLALHLQLGTRKSPHEVLSDREFAVLQMIASGKTASEIAGKLALSVKTVSTYRSRILEKTGLRNNAQLMRYALEHRLALSVV